LLSPQPIFSPLDDTGLFLQSRLTNFFDLSNIRVESGGAGEMFGASRCSRKTPFQFDGQPALEAELVFGCNSSTPPTIILQFPRAPRVPACEWAQLRSFCGVDDESGAKRVSA
jgi:hypothetical protein